MNTCVGDKSRPAKVGLIQRRQSGGRHVVSRMLDRMTTTAGQSRVWKPAECERGETRGESVNIRDINHVLNEIITDQQIQVGTVA